MLCKSPKTDKVWANFPSNPQNSDRLRADFGPSNPQYRGQPYIGASGVLCEGRGCAGRVIRLAYHLVHACISSQEQYRATIFHSETRAQLLLSDSAPTENAGCSPRAANSPDAATTSPPSFRSRSRSLRARDPKHKQRPILIVTPEHDVL